MDNAGDLMWSSFWQGVGIFLNGLWETMLANPWMFLVVIALLGLGLYDQLTPKRRRRRAR